MSEKFYEKFTEKKTSKTQKKNKNEYRKSSDSSAEKQNRFTGKTDTKSSLRKSEQKHNSGNSAIRNSNKYEASGKNISRSTNSYKIVNHQFDVKKLPEDCKAILTNFDSLLQEIRPLNSKQILQLPENIRSLSHQLTDERSTRRLGYMNENIQLSAYVRYFTWWNLVRMTRLFANLPEKSFPDKDCVCIDLGSGPLTVVNSLWLARPELRKLNLTWYVLDVSQNALTFGEDIYMSIAAKTMTEEIQNHWKIIRIKDSFGAFIKQKADFITCGNMFNELDQSNDMPPEFKVKKYYEQLKAYSNPECKFLLIEPGVPKSARTLCLFRERFIRDGNSVIAPCSHEEECPMNGFKSYTGSKNKWCNFAFNTEDAPARLQKLSETAKLPKERAVLSFLSVCPGNKDKHSDIPERNSELVCRVTSDEFTLPGHNFGHYGCSKLGLVLLRNHESGKFVSGDLLAIEVKTKTPDFQTTFERDQKSGALIIDL